MKQLILTLGIATSVALNAQAHFIFLELPPEQPNIAQMRFSEEPLERTDAELQEKSAPMTVTTVDDKPLEFAPGKEARLAQLPTGVWAIKGSLDYGIMNRGGEYLLVYHAKAVRDLEGAGKTVGLPMEVLSEVKDGEIIITVLMDGKPAPGAELVVNLPTVKRQSEITTDDEGRATFPIEPGGWVGIRAKVQAAKKGIHGNTPYEQVRIYSTLTFPYLEK